MYDIIKIPQILNSAMYLDPWVWDEGLWACNWWRSPFGSSLNIVSGACLFLSQNQHHNFQAPSILPFTVSVVSLLVLLLLTLPYSNLLLPCLLILFLGSFSLILSLLGPKASRFPSTTSLIHSSTTFLIFAILMCRLYCFNCIFF